MLSCHGGHEIIEKMCCAFCNCRWSEPEKRARERKRIRLKMSFNVFLFRSAGGVYSKPFLLNRSTPTVLGPTSVYFFSSLRLIPSAGLFSCGVTKICTENVERRMQPKPPANINQPVVVIV